MPDAVAEQPPRSTTGDEDHGEQRHGGKLGSIQHGSRFHSALIHQRCEHDARIGWIGCVNQGDGREGRVQGRLRLRRLQGTAVTANAVQPGVVMTNLGRYLPEWKMLLSRVIGFTFMKSLEAGAATQCYVATYPALAGVSGYVFKDCNPVRVGGHSEDDAMAAKLWQVSEELTRTYLQ